MEFTPDCVEISQSVIQIILLHSNKWNSTSVRLILSEELDAHYPYHSIVLYIGEKPDSPATTTSYFAYLD